MCLFTQGQRTLSTALLVALAFGIASDTAAQVRTESPEGFIREQQTGIAELPDGAAFKIFLDMATTLAQGDRPVLSDYLQRRMGLSADRAGEMAAMLLESRVNLAEELQRSRLQLLCAEAPDSRTPDDIYRLFGMSDDLSDAIADKYLLLFKSQVTAEEAARMQQMIDLEKENMGRAKMDHKKVYESTGTNPNDMIAGICSN